MIREGDRIAVAVSGGKDSVTLLEVLLLLPFEHHHKSVSANMFVRRAEQAAYGGRIRWMDQATGAALAGEQFR